MAPFHARLRAAVVPRARALGAEIRARATLSPIARRRLANFRANRRALWSLRLFGLLFAATLLAELVANDRPLLVSYEGSLYVPVLADYPDTTFGGPLGTETDYRDPITREAIEARGFILWPLIPYSYDTRIMDKGRTAPAPPDAKNWLGTDDQQRDVLARLIYGFRLSVLFGLVLTISASLIGVSAGAVQGYFGGLTDLVAQRFIEIWTSVPALYVIIILAAVFAPSFGLLLGILLLFSWTALVGVVRAEFLRTRNFEYVTAARALGVSHLTIMYRHILPNAMVATLTMLPFVLNGSITTLTALDFLGFGLPPGSPSLGELLAQGKRNLQAPWLGLTAFFAIAVTLSLLIFIGEGLRDAFDPRKAREAP
ncbi:MAG: ABC transporter permease [Alphaproteobacteria bacterium]|nr:ABC transporter permease [Alphaproteobacteria bacterium]